MIHLREPTYSGRSHALVQIFGFLYAFIAGFLLTAVPRFTGTQPPSLATQLVLAGLLLVASVSSELRAFATATIAFVAAHVMLLTLIVQRFAKRTQNPPPSFANIGLEVACGSGGCADHERRRARVDSCLVGPSRQTAADRGHGHAARARRRRLSRSTAARLRAAAKPSNALGVLRVLSGGEFGRRARDSHLSRRRIRFLFRPLVSGQRCYGWRRSCAGAPMCFVYNDRP